MLSEKFRISCSQIGKIMTKPRTGTGLSETAKSYCKDWIKQQLYSRRKSFTSKYTDKGNFVESQAIEYLESALGWDFAVKNETRRYSDLIEGECDVILQDRIIDLKCSYDCFTFPLFDTVIPEKDYEYQIQGYMYLYGKTKGEVIFSLMDTPEEVIQKEVRWKLGEEYTREQYEAFYATFIYSGLPDDLRIKRFQFESDFELISAIEYKVLECRDYIKSLGF